MGRDAEDRYLDAIESFIEDFVDLMQGFSGDIDGLREEVIRLLTEAEHHHQAIDSLSKVVVDGNGQPPLMSRMASLEARADGVDEAHRKWWELLLVALPGVVSLIATVAFVL